MMKSIILIAIVALCSTVSSLDLSRAQLKKLLGEHLYEIEYELDNMNINSLAPDTFADVSNTLEKLDLSYNKFTSLPPALFKGLKKLRTLNLGNNNLKSVNKLLFTGLMNLEELKLKSTQLATIDLGTFNGLSKLHTLDLSMNFLIKFDNMLFKDLKNLVELELSYNKITDVNKNTLAYQKKIKEISLDNNQLTSIDVNFFNKLCLERLSIDHNKCVVKYDVRKVKKCIVVSGIREGKGSNTGKGKMNSASGFKSTGIMMVVGSSAIVLFKSFF